MQTLFETKYGVVDLEASYNDGYITGMNWNDPWTPGGPYVYRIEPWSMDEPWREYCVLTQKANDAWRKGWKDARAVKE